MCEYIYHLIGMDWLISWGRNLICSFPKIQSGDNNANDACIIVTKVIDSNTCITQLCLSQSFMHTSSVKVCTTGALVVCVCVGGVGTYMRVCVCMCTCSLLLVVSSSLT